MDTDNKNICETICNQIKEIKDPETLKMLKAVFEELMKNKNK